MLPSLAAVICLWGVPPEYLARPAYLLQMYSGPDNKVHLKAERYQAQPGDLVLFDSHDTLIKKLYHCCNSGTPLHAGIVFLQKDGTPAILEAGTNAVMKVFVFDMEKRLHDFDGTILVRRLRKPLTPAQATQLREFAEAQEGKGYALIRAILHASPLRPRDPILTSPFGRTVLDRDRWICSELAVAAATAAGVLDPSLHPANMMLPRDLCYDERYDLSAAYETPALWSPRETPEKVGSGVRVGETGK